MPALLPLFPLQVVVFPRTALPLHIFEERYKTMVGEAIRNESEFGIVLAREDGIVNTGCTVVVEKVLKRYRDGKLDIVTRGRRRFEIVRLNQEQDYLQAEVQFFDDDDPAPPPAELQVQALTIFKEFVELRGMGASDPDLNDRQLSFQLARALDDMDFLNVLLQKRSEADRLRDLNGYVNQQLPRLRETARISKVHPLNGFGGKIPEV